MRYAYRIIGKYYKFMPASQFYCIHMSSMMERSSLTDKFSKSKNCFDAFLFNESSLFMEYSSNDEKLELLACAVEHFASAHKHVLFVSAKTVISTPTLFFNLLD